MDVVCRYRVKRRVLRKKDLFCGFLRLKFNGESFKELMLVLFNYTKLCGGVID